MRLFLQILGRPRRHFPDIHLGHSYVPVYDDVRNPELPLCSCFFNIRLLKAVVEALSKSPDLRGQVSDINLSNLDLSAIGKFNEKFRFLTHRALEFFDDGFAPDARDEPESPCRQAVVLRLSNYWDATLSLLSTVMTEL